MKRQAPAADFNRTDLESLIEGSTEVQHDEENEIKLFQNALDFAGPARARLHGAARRRRGRRAVGCAVEEADAPARRHADLPHLPVCRGQHRQHRRIRQHQEPVPPAALDRRKVLDDGRLRARDHAGCRRCWNAVHPAAAHYDRRRDRRVRRHGGHRHASRTSSSRYSARSRTSTTRRTWSRSR